VATRAAPALTASNIVKSFGATQALTGATLALAAGEVHALLGENGSGKSTLAKVIAGIHLADSGEIRRDGQLVAMTNPPAARASGIGIVFQDLSLAASLNVVDNMFLGRERSRGARGWLDRRSEIEDCKAMLQRLGIEIDPRASVRRLGMAQKQMVEIGKCLLQNPSILILDEPTSSLTEHEINRLFALVEDLKRRDTAILYVTHHLREVLRIADRVSVMRDGQIIASQQVTSATTEDMLLALLTGKSRGKTSTSPAMGRGEPPLLRVVGLSTASCENVSFHIQHGEIVGLYGVVGCGREEISRVLIGLDPPRAGAVELLGSPYIARNPSTALRKGIGYLPSDRGRDGILPSRSLRENLTLSSLRAVASGGIVSGRAERTAAMRLLSQLRVKHQSLEQLITALSGGNQQKVLLGRTLAAEPKLLVLEDPTAGIDIGTKFDIYDYIRSSACEGTSFLWLSSDLIETLMLCHRVYAVYSGAIVDEIVAPGMTDEERLLAAVLGGRLPTMAA
jgi:ribose transport system ATP-binding protein